MVKTFMRPLTEFGRNEVPRVAFRLTDDGVIIASGNKRKITNFAINVTDLSVVRHIVSDDSIAGSDIFALSYQLFMYALRLTDTRTMRRLTNVPREVVTVAKDNIFMSRDILRYKIAVLRCVSQRLDPSRDSSKIEKHFLDCGLRKVDTVMFALLYYNNDIQDFIQIMRSITDKVFDLHVDSIPRELEHDKKIISEFNKAANYNSYGIRFVAHANRFDYTDLKQELLLRAVQAYYWVRPFYSKEHAINYAKRATHGHAQNLREFYQHPDRARALNTGDGYDNVICLFQDSMQKVNPRDMEDAMVEYLDISR